LNELPKTLDETYAHTLLGIDEEKRQYAQLLFRSLTVSIHPLSVEELAEILAVRFDDAECPTFDPDWGPADAEEAVLSACSSLISVVNVTGSRIVQFSHFSVKEYLTSERLAKVEGPLSSFHILPEPAHRTLAHASLSVLLRLDDEIDRNTILQFPLAPYASRHWVDHVKFRDVLSSPQVQEVMGRLFDPTRSHFVAWVWLYDIACHWVEPMSTMHPTGSSAGSLYYASYCGFRELVNHLIIVHSLDINARGGSHTTALHAASAEGHLEVVSLLLDMGADPNSRDHQGRTPLHNVSRVGDFVDMQAVLKIVRLLLKCGADTNASDLDGLTPLHFASLYGHCDIAELLLEHGTKIDAVNRGEDTPLMFACMNRRLGVARLLIDRGSNLKARNRDGWTLLHLAARDGYVDVDITRLLLDRGADVNACLADGETPLHFASRHGHVEIARLFIERGAEVDSRNKKHETPLDQASREGHLNIARLLMECGAYLSSRDVNGWTALHTVR